MPSPPPTTHEHLQQASGCFTCACTSLLSESPTRGHTWQDRCESGSCQGLSPSRPLQGQFPKRAQGRQASFLQAQHLPHRTGTTLHTHTHCGILCWVTTVICPRAGAAGILRLPHAVLNPSHRASNLSQVSLGGGSAKASGPSWVSAEHGLLPTCEQSVHGHPQGLQLLPALLSTGCHRERCAWGLASSPQVSSMQHPRVPQVCCLAPRAWGHLTLTVHPILHLSTQQWSQLSWCHVLLVPEETDYPLLPSLGVRGTHMKPVLRGAPERRERGKGSSSELPSLGEAQPGRETELGSFTWSAHQSSGSLLRE